MIQGLVCGNTSCYVTRTGFTSRVCVHVGVACFCEQHVLFCFLRVAVPVDPDAHEL
jgi:hypothetical protein